MPTYPVKNLKTGEIDVLVMSINDYTEWRNQNSDWDKDWSQGCATAISEIGDWRNKVPSPVKEKLKTIKQNHYGSNIDA